MKERCRWHGVICALGLAAIFLVLPTARAEDNILEGTVLKKLADGMEPGTFLRLKGGPNDPALPEGFKDYSRVQMKGTFHSSSDAWSPLATWSPVTLRVYQLLDRSGNGVEYDRTAFSGYDAKTHAWMRHKLHPESKERKILGRPHVYGSWALDNQHGKIYHAGHKSVMWAYDIKEETWSPLDDFPGWGLSTGNAPLVYHPDIGCMLVMGRKGKVAAWDPEKNTVKILPGSNPDQSGYHGHAVYNTVRREAMFWFGNTKGQVTLVGSDGKVVPKKKAPDTVHAGEGSSSIFLTYDPISGNYLSFGNKKLWEYNPEQDEWKMALDLNKGPNRFAPYHGFLMTAIPEAKVIMWNHRSSPRLYKHKSVFAGADK